jgi:hypothetical protein
MYIRRTTAPDNPDWRYLAGLWDGEGCVAVSSVSRNSKNRRNSGHSWHLQLQMTNTSETLIRSLGQDYGGAVYVCARKYPNRKVVHMWFVFSAAECLTILTNILPFLRYKGDEARLAIEYFSGVSPKFAGKSLSDEEIGRRNRIALAIRSLDGRRKTANVNARPMESVVDRRTLKGKVLEVAA